MGVRAGVRSPVVHRCFESAERSLLTSPHPAQAQCTRPDASAEGPRPPRAAVPDSLAQRSGLALFSGRRARSSPSPPPGRGQAPGRAPGQSLLPGLTVVMETELHAGKRSAFFSFNLYFSLKVHTRASAPRHTPSPNRFFWAAKPNSLLLPLDSISGSAV